MADKTTTTEPAPTKPADGMVRVECACNPDVHLGDGRILKGPTREGTIVKEAGDVAEVSADLAAFLIKRGQVAQTDREVTVEG